MREEDRQWTSAFLSAWNRHAHKGKSVWNLLRSVRGIWEAVWSCWGQTMARHPEEPPLCLCAATSSNLLLWDKTKLTQHFTADPVVLSDLVHQISLKQLWGMCAAAYELPKQTNGHYPSWRYSAYTSRWHRQLSTFTQVLMCNLSASLPCDIICYFPTPTTSESIVSSVGTENKCTHINVSHRIVITRFYTFNM